MKHTRLKCLKDDLYQSGCDEESPSNNDIEPAHGVQTPRRSRNNGRSDRTPFVTPIKCTVDEINDGLEDMRVIGPQADGHCTSELHLNASHTEVYHYYNHHWFKILILMDLLAVSGIGVRLALGLDIVGAWVIITGWLIIFLPSSALYTGVFVVLTKYHAKIGNAVQRRFHIQQSVQRRCIIACAYIYLLGVVVMLNFSPGGVGMYIIE